MNYFEAVRLAKEGKQEGYSYLYSETYKDKFYLALKYMKNEEEANDVLQDAYVKAFTKLDTLAEPEKFPSWLGMIVANTAKNALQKKNPVLFSELETEDSDGNVAEFEIEDESDRVNPELQIVESERKAILAELIGSLSDEQRLCVLMFYYDKKSISEIAQTFGVSENTIKSRLNYGKKNLKKKCEEYEKKGYKFLSVAPVGALMFLLNGEKASAMSLLKPNMYKSVVENTWDILSNWGGNGSSAVNSAAGNVHSSNVNTAQSQVYSNNVNSAQGQNFTSNVNSSNYAANNVNTASGNYAPNNVNSSAGNYYNPGNTNSNAGVNNINSANSVNPAQVIKETAKSTAKAKTGFLASTAGKVTMAVGGAALAGAIVTGTVLMTKDNKPSKPAVEQVVEVTPTEDVTPLPTDTPVATATPTSTPTPSPTPDPIELQRDMLTTYLEETLKPSMLVVENGGYAVYTGNATVMDDNASGIIGNYIADFDGDDNLEMIVFYLGNKLGDNSEKLNSNGSSKVLKCRIVACEGEELSDTYDGDFVIKYVDDEGKWTETQKIEYTISNDATLYCNYITSDLGETYLSISSTIAYGLSNEGYSYVVQVEDDGVYLKLREKSVGPDGYEAIVYEDQWIYDKGELLEHNSTRYSSVGLPDVETTYGESGVFYNKAELNKKLGFTDRIGKNFISLKTRTSMDSVDGQYVFGIGGYRTGVEYDRTKEYYMVFNIGDK